MAAGRWRVAGVAAVAVATLAAAPGAPALSPPASGPDRPATTSVAAAGTPPASRAAIGRDRLRSKLRRLAHKAGGRTGVWVHDADARRRRTLFRHHPRDRRVPASNQKLFTTAAALHRLGRDARLRTAVWASGKLRRGVLDGDLYLVGDGDPALANRGFARRAGLPVTPFGGLARGLADAGLRRVTGAIRADDSIFDRRRGVPASGFRTSAYIGPLSGLSFNSGTARDGFAKDPAIHAGRELKEDLERRRIGVAGKVRLGRAPRSVRDGRALAAVRSPRLAELVAETNHDSNNFFAETLLKRLAARGGHRGTTKRGARKVERFARRRLDTGVRASDGSGLGRANRASPRQIGRLLVGMLEHRARRAFKRSLPRAGREGTLASRMRGTAAEGRCRAKTGTLSDVSALSGYCKAGRGTVAFSILMNSVDVAGARSLQDRMAAAIARYRK